MNLRKMFLSNLAAVALLSVAAMPAWAEHETGGGSSGGGDSNAAHFVAIGGRIGKRFRLVCSPKDAPTAICKNLRPFLGAISDGEKTVVPRDIVLGPDKKPREAGNNGKDEIVLNVPMWKKMLKDPATVERQVLVVTHEYSVIAGVEHNDNYRFSSSLVQLFKDEGIDLTVVAGRPKDVAAANILPCASADLKNATIGFQCKTTNGSVLERVDFPGFAQSWKTPDGTIWGSLMGQMLRDEGRAICKSIGGDLPEQADFARGEGYRFREVLPDMQARRYWTRTEILQTSASDWGATYVFWGNDGSWGTRYFKDYKNADLDIRCVAKEASK